MIYAGIPTLGMSALLVPLVKSLIHDPTVDAVRVYDNGITDGDLRLELQRLDIEVIDAPGQGLLYAIWNDMIRWAAVDGADLAILNDDISMANGTLAKMSAALHSDDGFWVCGPNLERPRQDPAEVIEVPVGTYRRGGIGCWAFLLRADHCPAIDETFEVWYGDDDLMWKIEQAGGRACVARDAMVAHATSSTINRLAWVGEAVARDSARWKALGRL